LLGAFRACYLSCMTTLKILSAGGTISWQMLYTIFWMKLGSLRSMLLLWRSFVMPIVCSLMVICAMKHVPIICPLSLIWW